MNEEQNLDLNRQENYRTEYKEVAMHHRLFVSLRFIVAAFTITIQSALFTLYIQSIQDVRLRIYATLIPFVGFVIVVAILIIERRNISLFRAMAQRGKELEFNFGLTDGLFTRLSEPELVRPKGWRRLVTHTWGIGVVYGVLMLLWLLFSALSYFQ